MEIEEVQKRILEKFEHHPLTILDFPAILIFLRVDLKIKSNYATIIEEYNASARIHNAYLNMVRDSESEKRARARGAIHNSGSTGKKITRNKPSDSGNDGDEGGV